MQFGLAAWGLREESLESQLAMAKKLGVDLLEFSIAKYTTSQRLLQIRKFVQQKKRKDIDGKSFFNTVIPLTILSDCEGDFS